MNTCYITSEYPYRGSFKLVQACYIFLDTYIRYSELVHACSIFSDSYTWSLELVHACSIFLGRTYQVPGISTRLFYFSRHIYQVPRISTRLFYFQDTYIRYLELVHACSIFRTHILGTQNQYTPVLFLIRHIYNVWLRVVQQRPSSRQFSN